MYFSLPQVTTLPEPLSRQNSTFKLSFLTTFPEERLNYQHVTWSPNGLLNLNEFCNQKQLRKQVSPVAGRQAGIIKVDKEIRKKTIIVTLFVGYRS